MAKDKAEKPAEPAPAAAETKKKSPLMKMAMAGAVVVALEGATVFMTMKMAGGPQKVVAEPVATAPAEDIKKDVEVKLIDEKQLPNKKSGKLYNYALQVVVTTDEKNKTKLADLITEHEAQIRDHVRTIIASADTKTFEEPGLETLRRQIAYQLEQDVGKDIVLEVLIPKCTPSPGEF